jgi:peptidoglycan/xylan/chitin deacetylase (PgdA/CDA1 family)
MRPILSSCPPRKRRLAELTGATGATAAATAWERRRPALRIVNYHSVPPRFAHEFAEQLRHLSRSWTFAAPCDLSGLLEGGVERPTLLFCFDDGLASTVQSAAPILEAVGARAIFAVPAAWPDVPMQARAAWFQQHVYPVPTELHEQADDIAAPSWDDLKALVARGHEVWSHGVDHVRLVEDLAPDVMHREIVDSRRILEERLETTVRGYCPPVGYSVSPRARELIARTYELAFGGRPSRVPVKGNAFRIPRSNIEASWPWPSVRFQLSPLGDAVSRVLEGVRS